jgi:hypothetical protein
MVWSISKLKIIVNITRRTVYAVYISKQIVCAEHRVDRGVARLAGECVPPSFGSGAGGTQHILLRERGWGRGGPNSDEGTDTVVLWVYAYSDQCDFVSNIQYIIYVQSSLLHTH